MEREQKVRVVGKRRPPATPEECLRRAHILEQELDLLNPFPRPKGFLHKFRTHADYEAWRKAQSNPRLW